MSLCVCVNICIHMFIYVYVYVYACVYAYVKAWVYAYVYAYVYVYKDHVISELQLFKPQILLYVNIYIYVGVGYRCAHTIDIYIHIIS